MRLQKLKRKAFTIMEVIVAMFLLLLLALLVGCVIALWKYILA